MITCDSNVNAALQSFPGTPKPSFNTYSNSSVSITASPLNAKRYIRLFSSLSLLQGCTILKRHPLENNK